MADSLLFLGFQTDAYFFLFQTDISDTMLLVLAFAQELSFSVFTSFHLWVKTSLETRFSSFMLLLLCIACIAYFTSFSSAIAGLLLLINKTFVLLAAILIMLSVAKKNVALYYLICLLPGN